MDILIVEDQDKRFYSIINMFKTLIDSNYSDFNIVVKNNWLEAIQYYETNSKNIRLVVLDVRMPKDENNGYALEDKNTGIEIYRKIKQINKDQDIIFWTILTKSELEDEGIKLVDDDYILKSSDFRSFFGKIDNKLGTNISQILEDNLIRI
jgi:DNA-binding NarL/FixJ family response regulator